MKEENIKSFEIEEVTLEEIQGKFLNKHVHSERKCDIHKFTHIDGSVRFIPTRVMILEEVGKLMIELMKSV